MVDVEIYILDFLNQYYLIARKAISKNNGTWDKAIGDGIMSWFGPTNDTSSDLGTSDAINVAMDLRSSFQELQRQLKTQWDNFQIQLPEFGLKCGFKLDLLNCAHHITNIP